MKKGFWILACLIVVIVCCAVEVRAKGGGRGGGGRSSGGSRGSWGGSKSSSSWGGSKSSSSSGGSKSSSSSSGSKSSSSSKGNWFTNLFSSPSKTSSSSSPSKTSSSSSSSGVPKNSYPKQPGVSHSNTNYPKQPATNPHYNAGHDRPPSYSSLYPSSGGSSHSTWNSGGHNNWNSGTRPQSNFGMFTPQSTVYTPSYHFIPIMIPSHSYHHHHTTYYHTHNQSPGSSDQYATSTESNVPASTPAPISTPIVYTMDTPQSPTTDNNKTPEKPTLVVALNNMVFYGEFVPDNHIVVVIDEEYVDPGEIPERFLTIKADEQPDWFPVRSTTAGPEIQISVVQHQNATESAAAAAPATSSPEQTTATAYYIQVGRLGSRNPERVLDMQFAGDVDGIHK